MSASTKTESSVKTFSADNGHAIHSVDVSSSKSLLSDRVGTYVSDIAKNSVRKNGKFVFAISGGSLPKLLAAGLLKSLDVSDTDQFKNWHVFFADERCVPLTSDDSNYKGCQEAFLSRIPVPAGNIHTIDASLAGGPAAMARAYEKQIIDVMGTSASFDLILLGMGPDGHTCSLFPGHALLKETSRLVAHIEDSPKPPPKRITLTFPVIHAARNVAFVTAGASKAQILPKVLAKGSDLPASRAHSKTKQTKWFVDAAASSLCTSFY